MEQLVILIPVFNDWPAVDLLLGQLDRVAGHARVVLIDDGSTEPRHLQSTPGNLASVEVLRLRRNLGHQRAIATGFVYVHDTYPGCRTLVMDGDGEDKPTDIPALQHKFGECGGRKIVFAERTRRSETIVFRVFYQAYKIFHLALTGIEVKVGNFSVIPYAALSSLVVTSEIWNHYAAAAFAARLPYATVPTARGTRLSGQSRMNFVSLVVHGLSAISVYSDRVGVRLLSVSAILMTGLAGAVLVAGHATFLTGLLSVLFMQTVLMSFLFAFITLSSRSRAAFLPLRDCPYFIAGVDPVYSRPLDNA